MIRGKKYFTWTNRELVRLRECFHSMSNAEMMVEFAPHPIKSIQTTAYSMGLRRSSSGLRDWKVICARHKPIILRWKGTT